MKMLYLYLLVFTFPFVTLAERDRIEIRTVTGQQVAVTNEALAKALLTKERQEKSSRQNLLKSVQDPQNLSGWRVGQSILTPYGYSFPNYPDNYLNRRKYP